MQQLNTSYLSTSLQRTLILFILDVFISLYDHVKDNQLALNSDLFLIQETF